jgi:hypothetical protein
MHGRHGEIVLAAALVGAGTKENGNRKLSIVNIHLNLLTGYG